MSHDRGSTGRHGDESNREGRSLDHHGRRYLTYKGDSKSRRLLADGAGSLRAIYGLEKC